MLESMKHITMGDGTISDFSLESVLLTAEVRRLQNNAKYSNCIPNVNQLRSQAQGAIRQV